MVVPWRCAVLVGALACTSCATGPLRSLPRMLRAAREIQCGDEETARDAVERLRAAPLSRSGSDAGFPGPRLSRWGTLDTGTLDLVLDGLADGALRFPKLRREIESVALSWNYCGASGLGSGPSPVNGRGLRRWGLLPGPPEERFVADVLVHPGLGGGHDALFIHALEHERCVPLPWDDGPRIVTVAAPTGVSDTVWPPVCPVLPPHAPRPTIAEETAQFGISAVANNGTIAPPVPVFGARRPIGFVGSVYTSEKLTLTAPAVGVLVAYYPVGYLFVRAGVELATGSVTDGTLAALSYTWGIGYDDPHPGTFSMQLNHWTPTRFDTFDVTEAEFDVGYKIPYPLRTGRYLASSVHLDLPFNSTPSFVFNSTFKPWGDLFVLVGVRVAPFEKPAEDAVLTWYYGFGLFNWRPYKFSLAYYNWARNPLRTPFSGFVRDGAIVGSFSWSF